MAAEIVNLRQVRKQKARLGKERVAAENRASFGRTKAEKRQATAEVKREAKALSDHQLDDADETL